MKQQEQVSIGGESSKLAYAAPKITVYGKVADLTAGALSTHNDPGGSVGGKS